MKSSFCANIPKETEIPVPHIGQAVYSFLWFLPSPGCRKNVEAKNYPAVDSTVNVKAHGVNFILVEDQICNLSLFIEATLVFFPYSYCTNQFFCCYHFVGLKL